MCIVGVEETSVEWLTATSLLMPESGLVNPDTEIPSILNRWTTHGQGLPISMGRSVHVHCMGNMPMRI